MSNASRRALALLRIALGLVFLWAFADKVFGLGFATEGGKAWINGVSPTVGFLSHATRGPLVDLYRSLAGNVVVDWLFMLGLLGIGLGLLLGLASRITTVSGVLLMVLMYASLIPPENHPFIDDHIIYALALVVLLATHADETWGLGRWWHNLPFVRRVPVLR